MKTSIDNTTSPRNVSSSSTDVQDSTTEGILFCSAFTLEAVMTVVGNLLTIFLYTINKNLRKKSLFLVVNMAFADLIIGLVSIPFYTYLVGGHFKLWTKRWNASFKIFYRIFDDVTMQASLISAALISGERLYAIYWPLRHRTLSTRVYLVAILMAWTLAFLVSAILFPLFLLVSIKSFLYFWLPYTWALILVICGCNIGIWRKCKHVRILPTQQNRTLQTKRLTKTLLLIATLCLLSWFPLITVNTLFIFNVVSTSNSNIYFTASLLNFANSLVNPIVYVLRIPEFRHALCSMCRRRRQATIGRVNAQEGRDNMAVVLTPATQLKSISTDCEVMDTKF